MNGKLILLLLGNATETRIVLHNSGMGTALYTSVVLLSLTQILRFRLIFKTIRTWCTRITFNLIMWCMLHTIFSIQFLWMVYLAKCTIWWIATILLLQRFISCAFKCASFSLEFNWFLRVLCKHLWRKLKQKIKELMIDCNRRWKNKIWKKQLSVKRKIKLLRNSKIMTHMNRQCMKNSQVEIFYPQLKQAQNIYYFLKYR